MRWITHLDGGPRRVNHAAVALQPGDNPYATPLIFSFGGYCSAGDGTSVNAHSMRGVGGSVGDSEEPIDVHVLNTATLRWQLMPPANRPAPPPPPTVMVSRVVAADVRRDRASTSVASSSLFELHPSPSSNTAVTRRGRARSVAELHPLGALRLFRPPLDDLSPDGGIGSPSSTLSTCGSSSGSAISGGIGIASSDEEALHESYEHGELEVEDESIDSAHSSSLDDSDASLSTGEDGGGDGSDEDDEEHMGMHPLFHLPPPLPPPQAGVNINHRGPQMGGYRRESDDSTSSSESNPVPYQRYGHTVVAYKGKAYLWGGRNDELGSSPLLHEYDPVCNRWSVVPIAPDSIVPPSRDGHSAVVHHETMLVFGGYEEHQHRFSQECYAFDFTTRRWELLSCSGAPPQYRDFHTAALIDDRMYVYGGRCDEHGQIHSGQDIYCCRLKCLDLTRREWVDLTETMTGEPPTGRRSHSVWVSAGRMYLFGGYHSTRDAHFDDLYEYGPSTNHWRRLYPSGSRPSARRRQCTIAVGGRVFLFGGTMPHPALAHARDEVSRSQRLALLASSAGENRLLDLADLYVLDYSPSLATLCMETIVDERKGVDRRSRAMLPRVLAAEIEAMSTPNTISKPLPMELGGLMGRVDCNNG